MNFNMRFSFETENIRRERFEYIANLFYSLSSFFSSQKNIMGIECLGIKVIWARNHPGFEDFVKPRRPSYRKAMVIKNPLSGEIVYDGYYTYDFKISDEAYDELLECSDERAKEIIGEEFVESCENLYLLKKKVPEADVDGFVMKAKSFFEIV